jgi:hypothetical protein
MNAPTRFRLPEGLGQGEVEVILAERYAFSAETPLAQTWHTGD